MHLVIWSASRDGYDGEAFVGLALGQVERGDLSRQEENLGALGNNRYIATKRQQFDNLGTSLASWTPMAIAQKWHMTAKHIPFL